jgi:hypothetical protein
VIKINSFNDIAKDSLDEWIYFFKHSKVPEHYTAKGLKEVKEKMRIEQLSPKEKEAYIRHQLNLISERNIVDTAREEGEAIGLEKGIQLTLKIIRLYNEKHKVETIADMVGKSVSFVEEVLRDAGLLK